MNTFGEKAHIQQGWIMHNLKNYLTITELHQYIHQIYFQLVRTEHIDTNMLKLNWKNLLNILFQNPTAYVKEITLICKLILNTRDIYVGKGERKLSYLLLLELYEVNKALGTMIFDCFVEKLPNKTTIGSWKDVKQFADYIVNETKNKNHGFINYMVEVSNTQLFFDYKALVHTYANLKHESDEMVKDYVRKHIELTLVAKWMPRKSRDNRKYAWLFDKLADNMHSHYFKTVYRSKNKVDVKKLRKAICKSEMNYRKMVSFVNQHLNVVEILQTSKQTDSIDFTKLPMAARNKYHKSFLKGSNNSNSNSNNSICTSNYLSYLNDSKCIYTNGYLYEIVKQIVKYKLWEKPTNDLERSIANKMWNSRKRSTPFMENIALVDMSCSMNGISLYNAIALGIFIAEHNVGEFNNKLMMFGDKPLWVSFTNSMDICEKVGYIIQNKNNINSDLYSVFDLLIDVVKSNHLSNRKLKPLSVTILSDMQIESNHNLRNYCMYSSINSMFDSAKIHRPQLIFWNLKHTNGFPIYTVHNYSDVIMFSGFSEKVLFRFNTNPKKQNRNSNSSKERNSNMFLFNMLSNKRYRFIDIKIANILMMK